MILHDPPTIYSLNLGLKKLCMSFSPNLVASLKLFCNCFTPFLWFLKLISICTSTPKSIWKFGMIRLFQRVRFQLFFWFSCVQRMAMTIPWISYELLNFRIFHFAEITDKRRKIISQMNGHSTLPATNSSHLKIHAWKLTFSFIGWLILRGGCC